MNLIKGITIKNVKGHSNLSLSFTDLVANYVSIFVAPNGFGKSTIAQSFKSLKANKLELNKDDFFENKVENIPEIELNIILEEAGRLKLTANPEKNELKEYLYTDVITSLLTAKTASAGGPVKYAKMAMKNIVLYDSIPSKVEFPYDIKVFRRSWKILSKHFVDLKELLKDTENLYLIYENYSLFNGFYSKKRSQKLTEEFYYSVSEIGIEASFVYNEHGLTNNSDFIEICRIVKSFRRIEQYYSTELEFVLTILQIISVTELKKSDLRGYIKRIQYEKIKVELNEQLEIFNTTNRTIKAKEKSGKFIVEFLSPNKISNGERDVLSFIASLTLFKIKINKNVGILIIDEIFDYLDGGNLLVAQFYLAKLIEELKAEGKFIFPIVLTHLDPMLFKNFYLKRQRIHYLKHCSYREDEGIINLLLYRNNKNDLSDKVQKYLLHYHNDNYVFTNEEKTILNCIEHRSSYSFYEAAQQELEKYLNNQEYSPLMVLCATRIMIEKQIFDLITDDNAKEDFLSIHTTNKKILFAESKGVNIPGEYYLLQPLYNDGLHLNQNTSETQNKIISSYLKLNNHVVSSILQRLDEQTFFILQSR